MYYLIEHNRTSKETICTEYNDYTDAQLDGLLKELEYFQDDFHNMEVVIFEANSIDDLKRTHSRYFVNTREGYTSDASQALNLAVNLLNKK